MNDQLSIPNKRKFSNKFPIYKTDLHKVDAWKTIIKQDLAGCEVIESDSEGGSDSDSSDDDESDDDDSDDSSEMEQD